MDITTVLIVGLPFQNRHVHVTAPVLGWSGGDPSTHLLRSPPRCERRRVSGDARGRGGTCAGGVVTWRPLPQPRADALATMLDLDLDAGICHACLSFVSFALDDGDTVEIARQIRRMTPDLWSDGLAEPALAAVRSACELGVPDAENALADLERYGGRSSIARSIVRWLAEELPAELAWRCASRRSLVTGSGSRRRNSTESEPRRSTPRGALRLLECGACVAGRDMRAPG
jgi:hypothetical protein